MVWDIDIRRVCDNAQMQPGHSRFKQQQNHQFNWKITLIFPQKQTVQMGNLYILKHVQCHFTKISKISYR